MTRDHVLETLKQNRDEMAKRYAIRTIALFGSVARDQDKPGSDVDILVDFDGPATSKRYFGTQFYLEDLLNRRVDLVTHKALRTELRPFIERDAIYV